MNPQHVPGRLLRLGRAPSGAVFMLEAGFPAVRGAGLMADLRIGMYKQSWVTCRRGRLPPFWIAGQS